MYYKMMPYVRFAMHHVYLENYYINRSIWDHEIIFIESGSMKITIDDKEYIVKKNDCVLLRPDVHHIIEWNKENCAQPHVHLDFEYLEDRKRVGVSFKEKKNMSKEELKFFREDFYKKNNIDIPYVVHLKNPLLVKNILYRIIDEYTFQHPFSENILSGLAVELIGTILRDFEYSIDDLKTSQQLNETIIYMNENVDNNLTLENFADNLKVSVWTLIQMFNKRFKTSPVKYYNQIRYLRAKDLLQFSFLPINKISEKMGFQEPQTFSRWFKRIDGNYPSFYREQRTK